MFTKMEVKGFPQMQEQHIKKSNAFYQKVTDVWSPTRRVNLGGGAWKAQRFSPIYYTNTPH